MVPNSRSTTQAARCWATRSSSTVRTRGCGPEGGQTAGTKVAADKTVVAVIGTNCSSEARAAIPIVLQQAGLTMISPSNTAPDLTDPAKHVAGYFRTAHNDKVQGAVAAQFVFDQLKLKKAATIHDGSIYAKGLADVFADNFKKLGGTITAQEAVNVGDKDMKPVLTRIAAGKPGPDLLPDLHRRGRLHLRADPRCRRPGEDG